jgi:hypothetical protein
MAAPFVLDSNFFIQAYRLHYPLDVVPSFWLKIIALAERGIIESIDKVKEELYLNNDELTTWCKNNLAPDFFKPTDSVISQYILVTQWANSRSDHYNTAALAEFLDANEADAWLVAYSIANKIKIVTHETSDPNSKKRIKIPDACIPHGLSCVNTIEMFRLLGESF